MQFNKNTNLLTPEKSGLLIIDIQDRIVKVMRKKNQLIDNVLKLLRGANVLNLPLFFTEQYPQGLGHTIDVIKNEITGSALQKLSFSSIGAEDLFSRLKKNKIENVIVSGVETHVCVQQTVLDLLANDFKVFVAVDAVSSRKKNDYKTALKRMDKEGAILTTVESLLFELLQVSGTPEFKSISKIVK